MGKNQLVIDVAALKPLPGLKKNFKKSEKNACFLCPFSVLYVYMIKNYTQIKREILKKRYEKKVAKCKKYLYSNLIDLLMNNLNNERKHYV